MSRRDTVIHIAPDCPAWIEQHVREQARASGTPVFGRGLGDRQRQEIALRAASPKRANAGRVVEAQAAAAHLPLFIAADEPRLF